jgi:peptidoglycan/LPS O-acetylase OafA/YrhL
LFDEFHIAFFIKSICFAYLVLFLALHQKLRLPSLDHWGDISYGLYIYAFPIQQMIANIIPDVQPISMFMLSAVVTVTLALLSWHLVEKPALKMKGKINWRGLL